MEFIVQKLNYGTPTKISMMTPEDAANNGGYPARLRGPGLGTDPLRLARVRLILACG